MGGLKQKKDMFCLLFALSFSVCFPRKEPTAIKKARRKSLWEQTARPLLITQPFTRIRADQDSSGSLCSLGQRVNQLDVPSKKSFH